MGLARADRDLPFTNAAAPAPDLDKVDRALTDGENTQNRWTTSSSSIDSRTATACTNVKAANIKIYTVRVIDGNATLLRNCATNPNMYYNVQQADQLNGVFSSIAQTLAKPAASRSRPIPRPSTVTLRRSTRSSRVEPRRVDGLGRSSFEARRRMCPV